MDTTATTVIALVGMAGCGKSQVADIITASYAFEKVYFGGVVIDAVKHRGLELTPQNEALVRVALRQEFGMGVMADKSLPRIASLLENGHNVLIDGLYSYAEQKVLLAALQDRMKIIAVHSNMALRIKRLGDRKHRPLTPEQIRERDTLEIENLEKAPPIAMAQFHLTNNGSVSDLEAAVVETVDAILRPDNADA
jgi:dephospho-CoA kinase